METMNEFLKRIEKEVELAKTREASKFENIKNKFFMAANIMVLEFASEHFMAACKIAKKIKGDLSVRIIGNNRISFTF